MAAYSFFYYCLRRNIFSKIDHIVAVVFQKNLYDVLSNVMDIAFDSCKDNGTFLFLGLSAACHGIFDHFKGCFGCFRTH